MGLTAKEYYKLTPKEFYVALQDHSKQQELQNRVSFEASRLVCVSIWNAAGNKLKQPIKDAADFMPFPWDQKYKQQGTQSVEEMKSLLMGLAQKQNKKLEKKK